VANEELKELQNIRKLLVLLLYKIGAGQPEVAKALNLKGKSSISKMLPKRGIKSAEIKCLSKEK